jgi:PAS domain S-box-containing protein
LQSWRRPFFDPTSLNRRYFAANPAFQKMTGYSETQLRGLSPTDITHEEDRAATEAVIAAHAAGEPYVFLRADLGAAAVAR